MSIRFETVGVAPSVNRTYTPTEDGLVLSRAGRSFKKSLLETWGCRHDLLSQLNPATPYVALLVFTFTESDLWSAPNKAGVRRHKKVDVDNRVKATLDALCRCTANFDDQQIFFFAAAKRVGPAQHTSLTLYTYKEAFVDNQFARDVERSGLTLEPVQPDRVVADRKTRRVPGKPYLAPSVARALAEARASARGSAKPTSARSTRPKTPYR
jgi:hypothetical protein